jgi:hypothetical protein
LKQIGREIEFVAQVLDSSLRATETLKNLDSLNEQNLVEILKENKVAVRFENSLVGIGISEEELFSKFPLVRAFYDEMHLRIKRDSEEFNRIAGKLRQNSIRFILIKSDGTFPYETDNLDVLVRHGDLKKAVREMKNAGYREIVTVREPHKFLFRNTETSLAVHLHTRVEWEGTQFVNTDNLWNCSRTPSDYDTFLVPSPEDIVLITTAHFFFENHEITISDLDKIRSSIQKYAIDWNRVLNDARKQCWDDAFLLAMALLDVVNRDLYGDTMLGGDILSRIEESNSGFKALMKTAKPFSGHAVIPLKIPYAVPSFFFVRRVLCDPNLSLTGKAKHLNSVASSVVRRITKQL